MKTVNINEAKTHLSKLIQEALNGEKITISRYGQPLVTIEPVVKFPNRKPGLWKGQVWMAEDFDELPEDFMKVFRGEGE